MKPGSQEAALDRRNQTIALNQSMSGWCCQQRLAVAPQGFRKGFSLPIQGIELGPPVFNAGALRLSYGLLQEEQAPSCKNHPTNPAQGRPEWRLDWPSTGPSQCCEGSTCFSASSCQATPAHRSSSPSTVHPCLLQLLKMPAKVFPRPRCQGWCSTEVPRNRCRVCNRETCSSW